MYDVDKDPYQLRNVYDSTDDATKVRHPNPYPSPDADSNARTDLNPNLDLTLNLILTA